MKIVQEAEVPVASSRVAARGGRFEVKYLLLGDPTSLENFGFYFSRNSSDLVSPRHRHNFDQIRIQLTGTVTYNRTRKMTPGMIGYFPEGAHYGPHAATDDTSLIVFQFGGASGMGYMAEAEFQESMSRLKAAGCEFKDGYCAVVDSEGRKRNRDAYEAVWEAARQRPIVYPSPRYDEPIFVDPGHWPWTRAEETPGVERKSLGAFGETGPRIALCRVAAGARVDLAEHGIYFVLGGRVRAETRDWGRYTAIHLERGERLAVSANEATEIVEIALPDLSLLDRQRRA